ncbi:MAG: HutD family protein [Bdellovibrio sp.]|nr:HutD family protein [Bdellovibrio sp.]
MIKHLKKSDYRIMPWKNGLGSTAQIDIFPEGVSFPGEDFLWRVSSATIASAAPFSRFDGCHRILVVWRGAGLRLNGQELKPHIPYFFAGETPIDCELLDGEVIDLGVIYRRQQVEADMVVGSLAAGDVTQLQFEKSSIYYLFCAEGRLVLNKNWTLEDGETLQIQKCESGELSTSTGGCYYLIKLQMK